MKVAGIKYQDGTIFREHHASLASVGRLSQPHGTKGAPCEIEERGGIGWLEHCKRLHLSSILFRSLVKSSSILCTFARFSSIFGIAPANAQILKSERYNSQYLVHARPADVEPAFRMFTPQPSPNVSYLGRVLQMDGVAVVQDPYSSGHCCCLTAVWSF